MARLGQSDLEFDSPSLQLCQGSWAHKSTQGHVLEPGGTKEKSKFHS